MWSFTSLGSSHSPPWHVPFSLPVSPAPLTLVPKHLQNPKYKRQPQSHQPLRTSWLPPRAPSPSWLFWKPLWWLQERLSISTLSFMKTSLAVLFYGWFDASEATGTALYKPLWSFLADTSVSSISWWNPYVKQRWLIQHVAPAWKIVPDIVGAQ